MRSTVDNGIETVASSLEYSIFATITKKVCLDAGRRYRFQIRNKSGGAILRTIRLFYGGETLFDSGHATSASRWEGC